MAVYRPSPSYTEIITNPQSTESIKDAGHDLKTSQGCSKCSQLASDSVKLMKCANCKVALYCSKECQKKDWPDHKSQCEISADQKLHTLVDLLDYFLGNNFLHRHLELALILELGIEPMAMLDKIFTAQFYVGIEPCDVNDFKRIWGPYFDPSKKVKMRGMFQVLGLTTSSIHPRDVPSALSRYSEIPDIADARKKADEMGHSQDTIVHCEFVCIKADQSVIHKSSFIGISLSAFIMAKQLKEINISEGIDKPLTVATCLEFINMHIRRDTENKLLLRSKMGMGDVKTINYIGNNIPDSPNSNDSVEPFMEQKRKTWKEKVNRESIYSQ